MISIRSLTGVIGAGGLWIEKLVLNTRETRPDASAGAFGELMRSISELECDSARLSRLAAEFTGLSTKLPLDSRAGSDAFDPSRPELIREYLEEVKALLFDRLLDQGRAE